MESALQSLRERTRVIQLRERYMLAVCALIAVALRVPFLATPLGIDEGGYAFVARQWASGDGALYGGQWVDRPPLLFAMYAVVMWLAGDLGIRLLGCIAAVVVVVATGDTAHRLAGPKAMRWTAVIATVLTASTVLQATTVNAELPAIAMTAAAVWCCVRALETARTSTRWTAGIAAGLLALGAMLIKQSFADAFAFAAAATIALIVIGDQHERRTGRHVLYAGIVGTLGALLATIAWAELHGPGFAQLVEALYGFRIEARSAITASTEAPSARAMVLISLTVLTGMLTLCAYVVLGLVRIAFVGHVGTAAPTLLRAASVGLLAYGAMSITGIVGGGNWWLHYLVQPVPFLAIGAGVVIATPRQRTSRVVRASRRWTAILLASTLVIWAGTLVWVAFEGTQRSAAATGDWLRDAAAEGDTALVTWGHANVLHRSGLATPYRLAWSLPIRVQDPELHELSGIMKSAAAPTWVVEWRGFNSWGLDARGELRAAIKHRYVQAAEVCGKTIYRLRDSTASSALALLPSPPTSACGSGRGLRIGDVRIF